MVHAHEQPPVLTLAVEGQATMLESPAVHAAAVEHIARGGRSVRVDLRDCTAIDSTFTGTLLSVERELARAGGNLVLVSPSEKVEDALREMGLDDFYATELGPRGSGPWRELAAASPREGGRRIRQLVLAAHDELARIPGRPARLFGPVADRLREGDAQEGDSPPSGA